MCLTFLFYYPYTDLSLCASMPNPPIAYAALQQELSWVNVQMDNLLHYTVS